MPSGRIFGQRRAAIGAEVIVGRYQLATVGAIQAGHLLLNVNFSSESLAKCQILREGHFLFSGPRGFDLAR